MRRIQQPETLHILKGYIALTQKPKLSARLAAAGSLVRDGAFVADVGTDHAYLPISLCLEGKICGGVASDINQGPIDRATKNINYFSLSDRLSAKKADGLCGIDAYNPTDILILGMGGELIARILKDAPWTKSPDINLCLQPMTHAEDLREFLCREGYTIENEILAREDNRVYQLMLARFTGKCEQYTDIELLLGRHNIARRDEDFEFLARRLLDTLHARIDGKKISNADTTYERQIIQSLEELL